jgi:hypothetical protein
MGVDELVNGLRRDGAPRLDVIQQRVLESMGRDGIAFVSFHELFGDERLWADLDADIHDFARATEEQLDKLRRRVEGKTYIARRFVVRRVGDAKPRKWKFPLTDRWLQLGLSSRILDIVNSYRAEPTYLIDLDNWYTIPDPDAQGRIESQQWHRDPWDNHIVKVFIYFSDVDDEAGPFEYVRGSPAGGPYGALWPWVQEGIYPPPEEFEAVVAPADRLKVTGPTGTIIFCDTSGFHCGGAAKTKPRILSYHTYVCPSSAKSPRFRVSWSTDGGTLSREARFAVSWSIKRK